MTKKEKTEVITMDVEDIAEDATVEQVLEKYGLRDKRAAFVREYVVDNNATQAAKRAGYSAKTAYSQGWRLLRNAEIAKVISKIRTARINSMDFGKEDLIAYRIGVLRSPTASEKDKAVAAQALQKIWGLEKNELNVNLNGNLAERLANARSRRKK